MRELSLHVLDVAENALEAGASRIEIRVDEGVEPDLLRIEIVDNGRGMSKELVRNVLDPFCTTRKTRHVGLGLPLFRDAAQRCDGSLAIQSEPGRGTVVRATFRLSHIDRAPLGDMPSALIALLLSEHPADIFYHHRVGDRDFQLDTAEIRKELVDVSLSHPTIRDWIFQELREGEANLHPSVRGAGSAEIAQSGEGEAGQGRWNKP